MNKKIFAIAIVAIILVGVLATGFVSAYFTDTETATNVFTIGKVDIELQEPNWVEPSGITPEQEIVKDPRVKNVGINDAYVFLKVEVPYAFVETASDNGTKNVAVDTELFAYSVNDGWVLVEDGIKDADAKTVTYVYAYGVSDAMTVLAKDATTCTLFDCVKFANVVGGQGLEGTVQNIVVTAYAIQTTNINDGNTGLDGNNDDGKVSPADVWAIVSK